MLGKLKTGQTTSYVDYDDGYYQKGLSRSYTRENGIVIDQTTGLQWQDDYSNNGGSVKKATWEDAKTYCENLTLGGYSDWRLPSIEELKSIVDYGKSDPAIDPIFENVVFYLYWSSTTLASFSSNAWFVHFADGHNDWDNKSYSYYVRCVRDNGGSFNV